jgi:hypothetical protein
LILIILTINIHNKLLMTHVAHSRLTETHMKKYLKDIPFTLSPSEHHDEDNSIVQLHFNAKKHLTRFNRQIGKDKGFRVQPSHLDDIKVHDGNGLFDSIKRGFESIGNKVKDTFSPVTKGVEAVKNTFTVKNLKDAAKVAIPGVVGGVTSFGVGAATTAASENPLLGAAVGGLAGAAASKATSNGLNRALGDGIKPKKQKIVIEHHEGAGITDMFMSFVSDPRVQSALLAAGSYAAKKGIDAIINRVGRSKVDKAKEILDQSDIPYKENEYYKKADELYSRGVNEQKRYRPIKAKSDVITIGKPVSSNVDSTPSLRSGSGIRRVKGGVIMPTADMKKSFIGTKSAGPVSGVVVKGEGFTDNITNNIHKVIGGKISRKKVGGSFSGLGGGSIKTGGSFMGGSIKMTEDKAVEHAEKVSEFTSLGGSNTASAFANPNDKMAWVRSHRKGKATNNVRLM